MKKTFYFTIALMALLIYLVPIPGLAEVVKNPDKPAKGILDLAPQKKWSFDAIGEDFLTKVRGLVVLPNGNLLIGERKLVKFYIVNPDGKLVRAFGRKGEGPGEFKFLRVPFLSNDQLVIPDGNRVHYYNTKGEFIRDTKPGKEIHPRMFVPPNQFIKFHRDSHEKGTDPNYIERFDLDTKETVKLVKFDFQEKAIFYSEDALNLYLTIAGTTPIFVFGTDGKHLFYGFNDIYKISKIDLTGKELLSFSVPDRKKKAFPAKSKRQLLQGYVSFLKQFVTDPEKALNKMIKTLPDETPFFSKLIIDPSGRIYVCTVDKAQLARHTFDIFSPDGKYLYKAHFDVSNDFVEVIKYVFSFQRNELFVFGEDEEGDGRWRNIR